VTIVADNAFNMQSDAALAGLEAEDGAPQEVLDGDDVAAGPG
jgi:hypothetical protein